jgi:3-(3-hydroxy-phenyl)propionate hydroxylase
MRRRWEIMVLPSDDPEQLTQPDFYWPLVARWISPAQATVERAAAYTFHSVLAHTWQNQRLLIAGDAAHQTPPFLGQGMCAGLRDAANLAWKLHAVLSGQAHSDLLLTYGSERVPHVREFIDLAVRLGAIIQETNPERARLRDANFAAQGAEIFAFPQPRLGPGAYLSHQPQAGSVAPQFTLPQGQLMDDVIGHRFALLVTAEQAERVQPSHYPRLCQADVAQLTAEPGSPMHQWLAAHQACAALLRPDRYVAGLAHEPAELAELEAWLAALLTPK